MIILNKMIFRQATINDIPALVECRIRQLIDEGQIPDKDIAESNARFFREHFESGQMEEWVCEDDGRIVATGAILWFRFPPSFTNGEGLKAYITNIYTDPEYRGQGIAPKILEILENRARERGACRIWLEGSKWGLPVYKKYGFSENNTILTIENELKQED